jgi:hypothetical protein
MPNRPKLIKFNKLLSQRDPSEEEAQRLIKLRKEVKRLKRQQIIITTGACLTTAIIVYLLSR